jgi:hypothetical protein
MSAGLLTKPIYFGGGRQTAVQICRQRAVNLEEVGPVSIGNMLMLDKIRMDLEKVARWRKISAPCLMPSGSRENRNVVLHVAYPLTHNSLTRPIKKYVHKIVTRAHLVELGIGRDYFNIL